VKDKTTCECERGPVAFRLSLTKIDGELIDAVEMCRECVKENAVMRSFDALGLSIP
jgi:hypothetical protein